MENSLIKALFSPLLATRLVTSHVELQAACPAKEVGHVKGSDKKWEGIEDGRGEEESPSEIIFELIELA